MTALAGFWSFHGAGDAARQCERMLTSQQVHAPEPAKSWSAGPFACGRRLYKLVPEDAFDRGPVVSANGRRVLVADVRLDNRDELLDEIGLSAAEAAQLSDTALLMRALERWDEAALDRLVGDFAFALWESDRQRLILARDYMGQRPLHYHCGRDFFAFASMPKGLHALDEVPIAPSVQAAIDFIALMPDCGSETFFEGVEKVVSAHVLVVTRDGVSSRKYWEPSREEIRLAGPREYEEALREHLDRATAARLRGGGNHVAASLSGGLDSTAVAASAARLLAPAGGKVTAFTQVPREGYDLSARHETFIDEGPHAAAVAALYPNMEHVLIRSGGLSPLTGLDRYFFLYERPFLNLCNGAYTIVGFDEIKRRGLTVLLHGQFGNLGLSYDGLAWLPQLLSRGRLARLVTEAWRLRRKGMRYGTIAGQTLGPFLPAMAWSAISRLRGKNMRITDYTAIKPEAVDRHRLVERARERRLDLSYRPRKDPFELRMWVLSRLDQGNYNKGALAAWGIDARDPTADRRLMEFCLRVPMEQYLAGGVPRSLARRALVDRLPDVVRLERRKGYQAADWHENLSDARDEVGAELARFSQVPLATELLDTTGLQHLVDEWPEGGWHSDRVTTRYRYALLRGVSAGHFLRRASGSNR